MKRESIENMAKGSWQLPLVILGLMMLLTPMIKAPLASIVVGVIYLLLFLAGLICGIIGCCGVKVHGRKKILAPAITGIALNVFIPTLLIAIAVPSFNRARSLAISRRMEGIVAETSKTTPVMIDEITRLDSVQITGNRSMTYSHTLVSTSKADIDVPDFTRTMRDALYDNFMTLPQMEFYRNFDIALLYEYLDQDGDLIAAIEIKKDLEQED
jgi:hypothetical protein